MKSIGIYDKCIQKAIHQELLNTKIFRESLNYESLAVETEFWGNFTTCNLFYSSIATPMGEETEVGEEALEMTNTLMQPRSYAHLNQCGEFFGN